MHLCPSRAHVAFVASLLAAAPMLAHAQRISDARVFEGAPLRIVDLDGHARAVIFAGQADSGLQVRYDCGAGCAAARVVPWSDLTRVDALEPHGRSASRMMLGGMVGGAGALVVTLVAANITSASAPCRWDQGNCPVLSFLVIGPVAVAGGALAGVIVGSRHRGATWVPVWP